MKEIRNTNINNFLYFQGIYPVREAGNVFFYRKTEKLEKALETYYIRYICLPNKKNF